MISTNLKDYFDSEAGRAWPGTWADGFGLQYFFYVSGVLDYFRDVVGLAQPEKILRRLKANGLDEVASFDLNWLEHFPGYQLLWDGEDPNTIQGPYDARRWHLHELGRNTLLRIAKYEPVTFPKAMIFLHNLLEAARAGILPSELAETVSIKLANCHIQSLDSAVSSLNGAEATRLHNLLGGDQTRVTVEEMRFGYPCTFSFACRVVEILNNEFDLNEELKEQLTILQYSDIGEVRNAVKRMTGSKSNGGTRRVASGEQPFRTRDQDQS